ncbi:MAG: DUF2062 domain-containing protein [Gammaproteobacteria bacterium]|nr:DUF2062 domain-containing protein [Gammaproteobacteria bacterium]
MPRRLIKRWFPDLHLVRTHRSLRLFGGLLHNPNLWHLNRRSVAGAFAVGLFTAFVPVPFQMVLAAALAIAFRVNLPISVVLVWISNPITMPPIFYSAYLLGQFVLGVIPREFNFELSMYWLTTELSNVWRPFLLGCFLLGAGSALVGYTSVRLYWRYLIVQKFERRQNRRRRSNRQRNKGPGMIRRTKSKPLDREY